MSQITNTYIVSGMTCCHCAGAVTREVQEIAGVENVDVVLETGSLTIFSQEPIDEAVVKASIEEAGYHLAAVSQLGSRSSDANGWLGEA